ncbi:platelet endothelial cell adhesion molecule isoform X5 [Takifugu rubripes]|uniref:platelet endothelial cell adhesion molecule isoform X5 n=1 Tax=Takifugu rubripes TaxID=31033 RepID=UPI001145CE2A|nr:platelet endothelial cell adhesion molecule-like isoform X5 [Takifugu rubripes]
MDLLLLAVLLGSYVRPSRSVDPQPVFTIRDLTLSIEPGADVTRDTNVTLRCRALVSTSGPVVLTREYTISKDGSAIYTKTSLSSEDLLYALPRSRFSNTGRYQCSVRVEDKRRSSPVKKLTVTGLAEPTLQLNKGVVSEGEEITATCSAPGETGSIFFYFYDNSTDVAEQHENSNQTKVKFHLSSVGVHKIHCRYSVLLTPGSQDSKVSNGVVVSVKELPIVPVLEVAPEHQIFEGDPLTVRCYINAQHQLPGGVELYLSQGSRLLSHGAPSINHSMVALAQQPGELECKLEMGNVVKVARKTISVIELFSVPTVSVSPTDVFQRQLMTLTCRSEHVAPERLSREELRYSLVPAEHLLYPRAKGVFTGEALEHHFNYTCAAEAKGIVKHSHTLTVRPKVAVSVPKISVEGRAILGRPVKILCESDSGSPPINYTLLKGNIKLDTVEVRLPSERAVFMVTISSPAEMSRFMCEASNGPKDPPLSRRLNTTVVEPLSDATLTVIPNLSEISEGDHLYLICGVKGSPPITFKWYRSGQATPVHTTMANKNHTDFQIPLLSKDHSGEYHCEAINYANFIHSEPVIIAVRLALWKKALIGCVGLLAASVLVLVCVLCFRAKRGRVDTVEDSMWSKPPPEDGELGTGFTCADVGEESGADVEYTEVLHPRPAGMGGVR